MLTTVSFAAVVDQFSSITTEADCLSLLQSTRDHYGLTNVVYFASRIPEVRIEEPLIAVTYQDEWVQHYKDERFVEIDPVVPAGLRNLLPTDWSTFDRRDPETKRFFGEAGEFGVGSQGLTIPIRGSHGALAMFSITSDDSDSEWALLRKHLMREFQIIAAATHDMILRINGAELQAPRLSPREVECLQWASEGKTYEDIATIMNIRKGTVKSYMEIARKKLNSINTTHTVTRAIRLGLI